MAGKQANSSPEAVGLHQVEAVRGPANWIGVPVQHHANAADERLPGELLQVLFHAIRGEVGKGHDGCRNALSALRSSRASGFPHEDPRSSPERVRWRRGGDHPSRSGTRQAHRSS